MLNRKEIPILINKTQYYDILKVVGVDPIFKFYKCYKLDNFELDNDNVFTVSFVDMAWYYGEIEFDTEEKANNWVIPNILKPYIVKEVTYDPDYKMKNYWKKTRLDKE